MLEVKNLTLAYAERTVIRDVSFSVPRGSVTAIIGANGCGKSTLLRALSRGMKYQKGSILLEGEELWEMGTKALAKKLAILPQEKHAPSGITARELIGYGRSPHLGFWGTLGKADNAVIDRTVSLLGLESLEHRRLSTLSGGEQQRVWIAMCLVQEPRLLLLDEPTTYLDIAYQFEILELIGRMNRELGLTIVMVLHDVNQAARYSDRMLAIEGGRICRQGSARELMEPSCLWEVFHIGGRVLWDEVNSSPFFIPGGGGGKDARRLE